VDAYRLLTSARLRAELTKTALAARAGTSTAALLQYERGLRSPTVATLSRLLAACGVQVRGELEPLHAGTDEVVDDLLARSSGGLSWSGAQVTGAFERSVVPWALDGRSAMAAHGLGPHPDLSVELVTVESDDLRRLLEDCWAHPVSGDTRPIHDSWYDVAFERLAYAPMYTRHGFITMRVSDELPPLLRVEVPLEVDPEDEEPGTSQSVTLPVLGLPDVEAAHPALATVLVRLRERRTVLP
jgi:transcriptional regulator with XRE-family HTH domain